MKKLEELKKMEKYVQKGYAELRQNTLIQIMTEFEQKEIANKEEFELRNEIIALSQKKEYKNKERICFLKNILNKTCKHNLILQVVDKRCCLVCYQEFKLKRRNVVKYIKDYIPFFKGNSDCRRVSGKI